MNLDDCVICPRRCHADRTAGRTGFCGMGSQMSVSRISLHFWEEPCISGQNGSGTVFFDGCSLGCITCQNARISAGEARGRQLSPDELAGYLLELQNRGAHNINLVTPTHFWPPVKDTIEIAKDRGLVLPIVCNTSGYENTETLRELDGLIDIYLTDLKFRSKELAARICGAPDYHERALEALGEMVRQTGEPVFAYASGRRMNAREYNEETERGSKEDDYRGPLMVKGTIVRHLMLPGQTRDSMEIVSELVEKFGDSIYISLMSQYTPMPRVSEDPLLGSRVSREDYEELVDYAIGCGLENGFFQGGDTDTASFIPDFVPGRDDRNLIR